jgi:hypothetical protein
VIAADAIGDATQDIAPFANRRSSPCPFREAPMGQGNGVVDVFRAGSGDLGDRMSARRVPDRRDTRRAGPMLAVDVEASCSHCGVT